MRHTKDCPRNNPTISPSAATTPPPTSPPTPSPKFHHPSQPRSPAPAATSQTRNQQHVSSSLPPSPLPQPPTQDRLQTALLYLARAAAQLPPASALAESLYDFAAPNWTVERWEAEVGRERGAASTRGGVNGEKERTSTGDWVRRAIGVLKREGEEGKYWRDGRDLEVLWGGLVEVVFSAGLWYSLMDEGLEEKGKCKDYM
ncbi:hypothetical protein Q7P35_011985 [Cladosporium inversicolor]